MSTGRTSFAGALASALLAVGLVACGSASDPPPAQGGCTTYVPPATFDAVSLSASFSADVMPIVARSCVFASCHGTAVGAAGGMYLSAIASTTYASLVGVPSTAVPSIERVSPGDPEDSLLQRKIDGDACMLPVCTGTCTESMPEGSPLLPESERLTIRAWIAQGANDD